MARNDMPSVKLADLLMGRTAWDDADEAIRSWASFHIYEAARLIIGMPEMKNRRIALGKIPAAIRPHIEAEIKRLWPRRGSL